MARCRSTNPTGTADCALFIAVVCFEFVNFDIEPSFFSATLKYRSSCICDDEDEDDDNDDDEEEDEEDEGDDCIAE